MYGKLWRDRYPSEYGERGYIPAITLDPAIEDLISQAIQHTERGTFVNLDPKDAGRLLDETAKAWKGLPLAGIRRWCFARLPFG